MGFSFADAVMHVVTLFEEETGLQFLSLLPEGLVFAFFEMAIRLVFRSFPSLNP